MPADKPAFAPNQIIPRLKRQQGKALRGKAHAEPRAFHDAFLAGPERAKKLLRPLRARKDGIFIRRHAVFCGKRPHALRPLNVHAVGAVSHCQHCIFAGMRKAELRSFFCEHGFAVGSFHELSVFIHAEQTAHQQPSGQTAQPVFFPQIAQCPGPAGRRQERKPLLLSVAEFRYAGNIQAHSLSTIHKVSSQDNTEEAFLPSRLYARRLSQHPPRAENGILVLQA
jgi:hypothetical protein